MALWRNRKLLKRAKVLLLISATLLLLSIILMPRIGYFLIKEHQLSDADAIVVLMGSVPARVLEADDVFKDINAREILLVKSFMEAEDILAKRNVVLPGDAELTRDALLQMGVPEDRIKILHGGAKSTFDEAKIIKSYLQANSEINKVILVTSSFHTFRTYKTFQHVIGKLDREVILLSRASRYDSFQPKRWWLDRQSAKIIVSEYAKLAYFYCWERWR
jgi:uncharacterized SAM-binding protein YcdF (DUF218 family)